MNNMSVFPQDMLERKAFLAGLHRHIQSLAETPANFLPSPRVLAVDAPWGSGKSWIANKLVDGLRGDQDPPRPVALIDAFRYDHHDDVFALIAASILRALKPEGERKKKFLQAVGAVVKSGAPMLIKAGTSVALRTIGFDDQALEELINDVKKGAAEGAGRLTEKAVGKLLDSYASTQVVQDEFVEVLAALTAKLAQPFVVVIDELDRCRPSFALEFLERIKHLFAAENVVFVLFWNADSIRESVRHSYGAGTNADLYLSKFIAYSIRVPLQLVKNGDANTRHTSFITGEMQRTDPSDESGLHIFSDPLAEFAEVLDASLRDAQKAIRLLFHVPPAQIYPMDVAYLALLKSIDERRFRRLVLRQANAFADEAKHLQSYFAFSQKSYAGTVSLVMSFLADESKYRTAHHNLTAMQPGGRDLLVIQEIYDERDRPTRHLKFLEAADVIARI